MLSILFTCIIPTFQHIKSNKPRSKKWVSTSVPEDLWDSPVAKYAKGDYYSNNLKNPVLFYEGLQKASFTVTIPAIAAVIVVVVVAVVAFAFCYC